MKRLISLLAIIAGTAIVTGCGQSGPLYLPGDPSELRQAPPPAEQPAGEDEDDEDEAVERR